MERNKPMIIGIACAVCCAACVGAYLWQVDAQSEAYRAEAMARYGGEQIEVCVATRDIAAGEAIADSVVETRTWLAALLPEGAVTTRDDVIGQVAGSSILKGEVVTRKRLEAGTAPIQVPEGLVAVSVPAHDVQAIGGALAPGMKADVYAIGGTSASKLLSDALIVATSTSSSELASTGASVAWVTLAVSPSAVEELIAAAENLQLYFALPHSSVDMDALAADAQDDGTDDADGGDADAGDDGADAHDGAASAARAASAGRGASSAASAAAGRHAGGSSSDPASNR